MRTRRRLSIGVVVLAALGAAPLSGQARTAQGGTDGYLRALGEYFRVPAEEVSILTEWNLGSEEIPVVLFLARRGGGSADALVALKRGGQSWFDLGRRYGLDAAAYHVTLPESADAGALASAYQKYRAAPSGSWGGITLQDREVVGLVNLRFLSEFLGVPPARVLDAAGRSGSFVQAYGALQRR